jgi:hypothetical protein
VLERADAATRVALLVIWRGTALILECRVLDAELAVLLLVAGLEASAVASRAARVRPLVTSAVVQTTLLVTARLKQ